MADCCDRYPIFESPYPLTIHESPVTCCEYFADCPAELIPALYSVGCRQKRQGYSKKVNDSVVLSMGFLHEHLTLPQTEASFLFICF